jgi:hypothetical protein
VTGRRTFALLVSILLCGMLLPASANASLGGDPGYHQPPVGACYDLTWAEAAGISSTEPAVPCEEAHTLKTIRVKRLDTPVRWGSDGLYRQYETACHKALYEAVGGVKKALMSAYSWWFFYPTQEERDAGAAWVRCDIGIHHAAQNMPDLPETLTLGSLPLPDKYAACLVGDKFRLTACSFRHEWKAKLTFKLLRLAGTAEQYQRQGAKCGQKLGTRRYVYDGPSLEEWNAGNHFMVCFKRHS